MKDTFESLNIDKRQRIIEVCIEEFALNSYEKASTNSIVKNAGISKGALFNYFGSKKDLFLYIFDYCIEHLMSRYDLVKYLQPSDVFERLVWFSLLKVRFYFEEPLASKLVVSAVTSMPDELKEELTKRYNSLQSKFTPQLLEDIDISKFRNNVDPTEALELIVIFLDGLSNKYMKTYRDRPADEIFNKMDEIIKECNSYLEILKYGIYNKSL